MGKRATFGGMLAAAVVALGGGTAASAAATGEADGSSAASLPGEGIIARFDRAFAGLDRLIFGARPASTAGSGATSGADGGTGSPAQPGGSFAGSRPGAIATGGAMAGFVPAATPAVSEELDSALRAETAARLHEGNAKTGLQLTGQTYYRVAGNGGYEDETGEGHYRAKLQAELRWYLLQSSLFGREGREREAALREDIARAGYEKERTDISDFRLKQFIAEHYDSLLSGVVQHRLRLLLLLEDAQRYLLGAESISSDEAIKALDARMEAERKLAAIEGRYPAAATLAGVEMVTVTVDSAALVRHVAQSQGDMKILQLRMALLEEQARNTKWWEDFRVAPFVRYARYFRSGLPDSYNVDAGFTFTIPIDDGARHRRTTLRAERGVLDAETERLSRRVADKTARVVAEIGRLNRQLMSEARRAEELKGYIALRTDAYRRGSGEYSRLARAREYTMYIAALERLLELQYRRDCLLADLQALLPGETVLKFCTIHNA